MEDLKKLLAAATPGPWYVGHNKLGDAQGPMSIWPDANMVGAIIARCGPQQPWQGWFEQPTNDAALIVAAVNALPALLDRVEALEAALSLVMENVEASASTYQKRVEMIGNIARAALAKDATT